MSPQKFPLVCLPTPLHRLPRLSDELGIELWIKRDDLTGFAGGGNKGRKLEYLIKDALHHGADTVVGCGSVQSNFVRQLAAAAAMAQLEFHAVTMNLPYDTGVGKPKQEARVRGGNRTLGELFGARYEVVPDGDWEELYAHADAVAARLRSEGRQVYQVPIGGSSPLGAYAFYKAGEEASAQAEIPFDWILTATSSGSTHAGLHTFFHGSKTRVKGISCDPEPEMSADLAHVGAGLATLLGREQSFSPEEFDIEFDYVGEGYGVDSPAGTDAIALMARREGILLDPVYSGKAFAGLIELAKSGKVSGRVLFWHTGGWTTLLSEPEQRKN